MGERPYRKERQLVSGDFITWNKDTATKATDHLLGLTRNDDTRFLDKIEYAIVAGSWLFGLAHAESDMDFKGFYVEPLREVLKLNGTSNSTGRGGTKVSLGGEQVEFQEIEKFVSGCISNNPTILEVLFADPSFILIKGEAVDILKENATKFLVPEKIFQAFSNYAIDQINYMKAKLWTLFTEEEAKLAESVQSSYDFNKLDMTRIGFGFHDLSSDKLKREKVKKIANFEAAYDLYPNYFDDRYDTKHAAHSLRLLLSGYHCLKHGEFITMPPADGLAYLREIRKGNVNLKDLFDYTQNMFKQVIAARANPAWERDEADYGFINDLLYKIRMRNR